jgi:hypothetical protein
VRIRIPADDRADHAEPPEARPRPRSPRPEELPGIRTEFDPLDSNHPGAALRSPDS